MSRTARTVRQGETSANQPWDWDDGVVPVLLERWLGRELPPLGC